MGIHDGLRLCVARRTARIATGRPFSSIGRARAAPRMLASFGLGSAGSFIASKLGARVSRRPFVHGCGRVCNLTANYVTGGSGKTGRGTVST